jgi:uncharacterized membrane protein
MQEYSFSIFGVLKEGFRRSDGVKWTFMGSILSLLLIQFIIALVLLFIEPGFKDFLNLLVSILTLPISVGILLLGVFRAREAEITIGQVFNYFPQFPYLLLGYILITIFTVLGFIALVIPGIYLSVAYIYSLSLIADKKLPVWQAMELSRKTVTKQWFKFFGLGIVSFFFILLSAIPFGIGLIWSIPTVYITYGLLYHRLFDEEQD